MKVDEQRVRKFVVEVTDEVDIGPGAVFENFAALEVRRIENRRILPFKVLGRPVVLPRFFPASHLVTVPSKKITE